MVRKRHSLHVNKKDKTHTHAAHEIHIIDHIQILLSEILVFNEPADVLTSRYFRQYPQLGLRERGHIAEAVFAVLRRRLEFEAFVQLDNEKAKGISQAKSLLLINKNKSRRKKLSSDRHLTNDLRRLAIMGLVASAGLVKVIQMIQPDEARWLTYLRTLDYPNLPWSVRSNLPDWIRILLQDRLELTQLETLVQVLQEPAALDLRVNRIKGSREQLLSYLAEHHSEWSAQPTPLSPDGIRLSNKPALTHMPWFVQGWAEVQDEGSQLLAFLVAPKRGEMIVDFCAGAGGKTLALGAMMRNTGRLYAIDISARRLAKLKPRLARSGLSNVHPILIDNEQDSKLKRMVGKFDRVLVDVPCSGLGTLRRNPDLKWRQTPEILANLVIKQRAILRAAAKLLKPGGRLVYATCSFLQAENQDIVEDFLVEYPQFKRLHVGDILSMAQIPLMMNEDLELWPHLHHTDGFYAAVLQYST